jgi:hypothetical protein
VAWPRRAGATIAPKAMAATHGMAVSPCATSDGAGRAPDSEQHQAGHRQPVVSEITRRGVVGRVQQDRCNKESKRQIGFEDDARRAWNERPDRGPGANPRSRCGARSFMGGAEDFVGFARSSSLRSRP